MMKHRMRIFERLKTENPKLFKTFIFLIKLLILSVPLYLVITFNIDLSFLQILTAQHSAIIMKILGMDVDVDNTIVTITNENKEPFTFIISRDSTGWKSMLFLFALIFSVPDIAMKKRLIGVFIGWLIVWIGNIGRVAVIVMTERYYGFEMAMIVHDYLWRFGLITIVLLVWIAWWKLSEKIKISSTNNKVWMKKR